LQAKNPVKEKIDKGRDILYNRQAKSEEAESVFSSGQESTMRCSIKELLRGDGVLPFSCELDPAELEFPSILRYESPLTAKGTICSSAGLLTLTGETRVSLRCICDRCGREYDREAVEKLDTVLVTEHQDEEDPDVFLVQDDCVDLDEIITTAFVLGLDSKTLCRPDCKGVCPRCGHNLNDGPCACRPEADSPFAVLGQLFNAEE